jgi:hypothetical protein
VFIGLSGLPLGKLGERRFFGFLPNRPALFADAHLHKFKVAAKCLHPQVQFPAHPVGQTYWRPIKSVLAEIVWSRTSVNMKWIAKALNMRSAGNVRAQTRQE